MITNKAFKAKKKSTISEFHKYISNISIYVFSNDCSNHAVANYVQSWINNLRVSISITVDNGMTFFN